MRISTTERYYLRLLLYHVRGPISYEDVRTVNGVQHDSFEAAAEAMGLKHTNTHFLDALRDAVHDETNVMLLQKFFVTLLIMLRPTPQHVAAAWDIFKNDLAADYMRDVQRSLPTDAEANAAVYTQHLYDKVLWEISASLKENNDNWTLSNFGLPQPSQQPPLPATNQLAHFAQITIPKNKPCCGCVTHKSSSNMTFVN